MDFFSGLTEAFGIVGGTVIGASWAIIGFLWREISKERGKNDSLQQARLDETKENLMTVVDTVATIQAWAREGR